MGDMGEIFNDMKQASKEKRSRNRDSSAKILLAVGIAFETKNAGAHLIVDGRYDFWPGTGKWIERGTNRKGRGVWRLIARMKE